MRDKPKSVISKSLVRNAEVPVPPKLTSTSNPNRAGTSHQRQNKNNLSDRNQRKDKISLNEPALNSALRIVKEMKQTSEMSPLNIQNPPDFTDKVTQKINVPYNEHLYHDLVALSISDISLSENVCSVKAKPHKQDRSPDLAEFHNPRCISDIPVVVTHSFPHHTHAPVWDGRKVYLSADKVEQDCYD